MKKTIIIAAVAALLTACGTGNTTSGTTTINVANMNGSSTDVTGAWVSRCFTDFPPDYKYIEEFSGGSTYKLTDMGYTTTDGSCGGTSSVNGTTTGTFTIGGSVTATGWIGNAGTMVAAPTAQDGVTTLPATPSATVLTTTITSASGIFIIPTNNPGSIRRAVDASVPSNIALFDIYNDGVNGLVADITFKATKQ